MHERRISKTTRKTRAEKRRLLSDLPETARRPTSRKGDQHTGHASGGGKKQRPPLGWEKGDVARDMDTAHGGPTIPVRPRRDEVRKAADNATRRARRRGRKP